MKIQSLGAVFLMTISLTGCWNTCLPAGTPPPKDQLIVDSSQNPVSYSIEQSIEVMLGMAYTGWIASESIPPYVFSLINESNLLKNFSLSNGQNKYKITELRLVNDFTYKLKTDGLIRQGHKNQENTFNMNHKFDLKQGSEGDFLLWQIEVSSSSQKEIWKSPVIVIQIP